MFVHQDPTCTSPLLIRATCLAHLILLDFITEWYLVQSAPVHTMTVHGRVKAHIYSVSSVAPDGGELSDLSSGRFNPDENSLGGPQRRFGCSVEEKNILPQPAIEPRFLDRQSCSLAMYCQPGSSPLLSSGSIFIPQSCGVCVCVCECVRVRVWTSRPASF
jgi:hypothetical protein